MGNVLKSILFALASAEKNSTTHDDIDFYIDDDNGEVYNRFVYKTLSDIPDFDRLLIVESVLMTVPTVLGITFLMYIRKRKYFCPDCLNGHFGLLVPVNFLEGRRQRLAFVAAFALTAMSVIDFLRVSTSGIPVIFKVFVKLGYVALVSLRFLPLLACIYMRNVVSCIVGLLYLVIIITMNILKQIPDGYVPAEILIKELLLPTAIHFIAGNYLLYWFVKQIIIFGKFKCFRVYEFHHVNEIPKNETVYLKNLLLPERLFKIEKSKEEERLKFKNLVVRYFEKHIYRNVPGFRYSLTILVSCTIGFIVITHLFTTKLYGFIKELIDCLYLLNQVQSLKELTLPNFVASIIKLFTNTAGNEDSNNDGITFYNFVYTQSLVILYSFLLAGLVAYLISIVTICHMLMSYRENVLNLSKQKTRQAILHIPKQNSYIKFVRYAIRFGGYQVAYITAGFTIQLFVLVLIFLFIGEIIVIPIQFAFKEFFKKSVEVISPFFIAWILIRQTQYFLIKFIFLEDRGKTMSLNNRRGFFIMSYFVFFYNMFTGIVSVARRILRGMVIGLIFLPRLDRSIYPRAMEETDTGFKAYSCLLRLEALQSNPIVTKFVHILLKNSSAMVYNDQRCCYEMYTAGFNLDPKLPKYKQVARNRWFVAYTMLRNPSIVPFRGNLNILSIIEAYSTPFEEDASITA